MANLSKTTKDHEEIRRWAEARGGKPSHVKSTSSENEVGILRIDFPGFSGEGSLEEISWDDFFEKFDQQGLALVYQEETADSEKSNFNKLVSGDSVDSDKDGTESKPVVKRAARKAVAKTAVKKAPSKSAARGTVPTKTTAKAAEKAGTVPAKAPTKAVAKKALKMPAKKSAPAKKAAPPAKKGSVKKSTPTKKIPAKKVSAKKIPAKKSAPAKKVGSKNTGSKRR